MPIAIASLAGPAFVPPRGINMLPAQIGRPAVPMPANRPSRQLADRSRPPDIETGPIGMPRWRYERHTNAAVPSRRPLPPTLGHTMMLLNYIAADTHTRVRRAIINPVPGDHVLPPLSAELPNQMPRASRGVPGTDAATAFRRRPPVILEHMLAQLNHCRSDALSTDEIDVCRVQGLSSVLTTNAETPSARPPRPDHVPHEQFMHGRGRLRHVHLPKLLQRMQQQLTALQSIMENGCASIAPGQETTPQRAEAHASASERANPPEFASPTSSRPEKNLDDEEMREWLRNAPDQHQLTGFGVFDSYNKNPPKRPATPHYRN